MITFLLRINCDEPERVRQEIGEWAEELAFLTDIPISDVEISEHEASD